MDAVPRAAERLRGEVREVRRRSVGGEACEERCRSTTASGARGVPAEVAAQASTGKEESGGGESKEEDEEAVTSQV